MPELHANQIRWEAPEPQKASFDKPNYQPLADAFTRLGAVADEIGERQRDLLDDDLKADLKLAEERANKLIEDEASANADYDQLSEKALSEVQGAFYKYDEATRVRFNRENKTYFDTLQLAVTDKILKKKGSQLINEVDLNIPLWASEVISNYQNTVKPSMSSEQKFALMDKYRKEGINKIQKALVGLATPEQIAKLEYKYNNAIDKANINNLITDGSDAALAEAETYLTNPKKAASLDPYERSVLAGRIKAQKIENAKEKKKAKDPLSLAVIKEYARYSTMGNTPEAQLIFQSVQSAGIVPVLTQDENGMFRMEYINTADMTPEQRLEIVTELKKYDNLNPNFERDKNAFNAEVSEALVLYQKTTDDSDSGQDDVLQHLIDISYNGLFAHVPDGDQKKVMGYINEQLKARVEASLGEEQQYTVNAWGGIIPSTAVTILGEYISGAPFGYNKKVGNPVQLLTEAFAKKNIGGNGDYANSGGIMASLMRAQNNQTNVSPYKIQEVSKAASIGREFSSEPTNPYKDNITAMILGAANIWRGRFARDMQKNSVAELGLYNKVLLPALRDNNLLDGTRFKKTNLTYEKAFSQWSSEMQRNGVYNARVSKENEKDVYRFFEIIAGDELTQVEKDRVKTILDYTKSGQANEDWGDEAAYLFTTEAPRTRGYSDVKAKPNNELMKTMTKVYSTDRVDKILDKSNL